jgi:hypothetical protein
VLSQKLFLIIYNGIRTIGNPDVYTLTLYLPFFRVISLPDDVPLYMGDKPEFEFIRNFNQSVIDFVNCVSLVFKFGAIFYMRGRQQAVKAVLAIIITLIDY